ncbi:MAG: hypothetical protein LBP83_06050 [Dysgonamonadaceae bacterium]|jgi:hypothetical protein|nr:hypothetical protein [Dysgonamonadaceae bacterium]
MKKQVLLILLLIGGQSVINTGRGGEPSVMDNYPGPNAASLGLFGQIPVSHFTGVPDINIPLYTIQMKEIQFPIVLQYHVGSVKPDVTPGWTGLGWALEAGGSITRVVKGRKDETTKQHISLESTVGLAANPGYYFQASRLVNKNNWNTNSFLESLEAKAAPNLNDYLDLEPDEFIFNFAGMSGSFYYNGQTSGKQQFKIKSKQAFDFDISMKLKEESNTMDYLETFEGLSSVYTSSIARRLPLHTYISHFTIIDQQGIQYEFGGAKENIDFITTPISNENSLRTLTTAVTWHLTSITAPNGEKITFEYKKEGDFCVNMRVKSKNCALNTYQGGNMHCYFTNENNDNHIAVHHLSYLEKISTSTGETIHFASSPSNELEYNYEYVAFGTIDQEVLRDTYRRYLEKEYGNYKLQLDTISISNANENIKNFYFTYSDNSSRRLRLNRLSTDLYDYRFKYNSLYLPDYNAKESDHWGFYNGICYGLSPFYSLSEMREPDSSKMKAETLEEITYPTGGTTTFEYEAHDYSKVATQYSVWGAWDEMFKLINESGIAGGLRIRKIISRPDTASTQGQITKEYLYTNHDGSSSGILSGKPIYETYLTQYFAGSISWFDKYINGFYGEEYRIEITNASENFLNPLGNTNGSHITYSRVIEKLSDGSSSIYSYTNHEDHADEACLFARTNATNDTAFVEPFTSRELGRGLLKSLVHRNAGNVVMDSTYYEYGYDWNNFVKSVAIKIQAAYYSLFQRFTCLKVYTFIPKLIKETTTRYDLNGSNPVTQETSYSYNVHQLLSETSLIRSDGKKQTTKLVYPFEADDYSLYQTCLSKMVDKRLFSSYVDRLTYIEAPNDAENNLVIEAEHRQYEETGTSPKIFKPEHINVLTKDNHILYSDLYPFYETSLLVSAMSGTRTKKFSIQENSSTVRINIRLEVDVLGYYGYSLKIYNGNGNLVVDSLYVSYTDWEENGGMYIYLKECEITFGRGDYSAVVEVNSNVRDYALITLPQRDLILYATTYLKPEIYYKYDNRGNIIESKPAGSNAPTTYLWGYAYQYPIAEIVNADYEQVKTALGYNESQMNELFSKSLPISSDWAKITGLQASLPNASITIYKYKPQVGLIESIDPRGVKTYYEYDAFGRLVNIKEESGKILENYEYHYKN